MTGRRVQLKVLFKKMSDLTSPECGKKCSCTSPSRCCDAMYCEMAAEWAESFWGKNVRHLMIENAHIPFLGSNGCVLEPHLRPLCTFHNCKISSLGFKPDDPKWTSEYFRLRDKIDEVQYAIENE